MNITISQIKAARALLGWTQDLLAEAANMSKPALANIERGMASPRQSTLSAIQKALESAGIEFTNGPGVRLAHDRLDIQIFRGHDAIDHLWDDIHTTLQTGQERLISGVDETKFQESVQDRFDAMMQRYINKGITGRILSLKDDTNFADPTSNYRWISQDRFQDIAYYIYAHKYAILLWEPTPRVILIHNEVLANNYRAQFNRHWDKAEIPPKFLPVPQQSPPQNTKKE